MHPLEFFKLFGLIFAFLTKSTSCEESKTWAVLHVGYDYYKFSYGMEAAIYKMYNILVKNGVPKSQIITISPDSAAYNPLNPLPGVIVHATSGNPYTAQNEYENVVIDYQSQDLDVNLFFEILNGNETAVKYINGSGKVLKTGPRDHVFVYTISLGTYGALMFEQYTNLYANTFIPFLENLKDRKRFAKMLMLVDTDNPGSMFDDYLDTKKNILIYTFGGRYSPMHMIELNNLIKAYTGSLSSKIFLHNLEELMGTNSTIFDHHILARNEALTDLDPLNLYGTLELGKEEIGHFVGQSSNKNSNSLNKIKETIKLRSDSVKLNEAFEESGIVPKTEIINLKNKLKNIISTSLEGSQYTIKDLERVKPDLPLEKYDCYKNAFEAVRTSCFTKKNQVIVFAYAENFAKMCSFDIGSQRIAQTARNICE